MAGTKEYAVEGYNVYRPEYDGPYLDGADFDPAEDFRYAGDPRQAEDHNKKRAKVREEARKARKKAQERRAKEREDGGHLGTSGNPDEQSNASVNVQRVRDAEDDAAVTPESKISTKSDPNRTDEIKREEGKEEAKAAEQTQSSSSSDQPRRIKKSTAKKTTSSPRK